MSTPAALIISILIKVDSEGPVLFWQPRVGQNRRTIHIPKFRTMCVYSEEVTDVGQILRQISVDEYPQLWVVLKGQMSIVGPRPVWIEEAANIRGDLPEWNLRHQVKPGFFDPAAINYIDNYESPEQALGVHLQYIHEWSIWLEVSIIIDAIKYEFNQIKKYVYK